MRADFKSPLLGGVPTTNVRGRVLDHCCYSPLCQCNCFRNMRCIRSVKTIWQQRKESVQKDLHFQIFLIVCNCSWHKQRKPGPVQNAVRIGKRAPTALSSMWHHCKCASWPCHEKHTYASIFMTKANMLLSKQNPKQKWLARCEVSFAVYIFQNKPSWNCWQTPQPLLGQLTQEQVATPYVLGVELGWPSLVHTIIAAVLEAVPCGSCHTLMLCGGGWEVWTYCVC